MVTKLQHGNQKDILMNVFNLLLHLIMVTSQQIMVPRTSRGRPPRTFLEHPLNILFDYPRDVHI